MLIPNLSGKHSSYHHMYDDSCRFFIDAIYQVDIISLYS